MRVAKNPLIGLYADAASAAEAKQQIPYDLEIDPGAYDDDLEPVEDGVGQITIKAESQDARKDEALRSSYMTHAEAVVMAKLAQPGQTYPTY